MTEEKTLIHEDAGLMPQMRKDLQEYKPYGTTPHLPLLTSVLISFRFSG